jgi:hypothetical protein
MKKQNKLVKNAAIPFSTLKTIFVIALLSGFLTGCAEVTANQQYLQQQVNIKNACSTAPLLVTNLANGNQYQHYMLPNGQICN